MPNARIGRLLQFGILPLLLTAHLTGQAQNNFEWKDASGTTRNLSDLEEIIRKHEQWLESHGTSGTRADLSHAYLHKVNLYGANLTGAILVSANLTSADLIYANLNGANLYEANLTGAILVSANLTGADLRGADLTEALIWWVNLDGAVFEPKSLPNLRQIATAKFLEFLTYKDNPDVLVQVRKQFEDAGFREQERKITYALKRREAELSWAMCTSRKLPERNAARSIVWSSDSILANCGSFVLNKGFFDWTCQYGMSPGRPLILGLLLWFVCGLLYFGLVHIPGESGLYRIYRPTVRDDPSAPQRADKISPSRQMKIRLAVLFMSHEPVKT